ncbi:hypothetical protein [Aliikangiella marina]|uniref:hypothetical protein n=1 Tax=Aliikangiella marina TaxID=1712262 RepID=UPI00163DC991|nr:hypothetical protein [Aliikangiella marina]
MLQQIKPTQEMKAGIKPASIFVPGDFWFVDCLTNNDVLSLSSSYQLELIAGRHQSLLV